LKIKGQFFYLRTPKKAALADRIRPLNPAIALQKIISAFS